MLKPPPRKVIIRLVPGTNCWCAHYVDDDGWETQLITTGLGLEDVKTMLRRLDPRTMVTIKELEDA